MSHINAISIKNYRGIKELMHNFHSERFIVLIGRGDSGKSTILSAINSVLSPSWNLSFSDLDFYNQDTSQPIEIKVWVTELPLELLKEQKFGLYTFNQLDKECAKEDLGIIIKLSVDETLEPKWTVMSRVEDLEDKAISAVDRSLIGVNLIGDYTDTQFAYNRQSTLYSLTKRHLSENETDDNIEGIKIRLLRDLSSKVGIDHFSLLQGPLDKLKEKALSLGLFIDELFANIDIKENPHTSNSISLHHNSLPYRLQGKGSKRLMSIAIQTELTKTGGIMLVDEIEQGLEPDRISTLLSIIKSSERGQVFITTHNSDVVKECHGNNLFIMSKGANRLYQVSSDLENCRRYNPEAFFAPKVICCEGDTEYGILRAFDEWLKATKQISLSTLGVSIANVGGGANMFMYSSWLKDLGINTCVFADDDKPVEHERYKNLCSEKHIQLFLCEKGKCIEQQIFEDLPWPAIIKILECVQYRFPKQYTIMNASLKRKLMSATNEVNQNKIREEQSKLAVQLKWFKHVPGGWFLGHIITGSFEQMDEDVHLRKTVSDLLNWCGI